jgi:hypothetical protein
MENKKERYLISLKLAALWLKPRTLHRVKKRETGWEKGWEIGWILLFKLQKMRDLEGVRLGSSLVKY